MHVPTMPSPRTLRYVAPWIGRPVFFDRRRQAAVHEAGHVVVMRWVGLPSAGASITSTSEGTTGEAAWPEKRFFAELPDAPDDDDGRLAASAASVFHAGVVAELIDDGGKLTGPITYCGTDYTRADEMLRERFGHHASGAHYYSQRVAECVLRERWAEVEAIASQLLSTGRWKPDAR